MLNTQTKQINETSLTSPVRFLPKLYYLFVTMRPLQWIKNAFVLIPLIFASKAFHYPSVIQSLQAVVIFSLLASATYIINDLCDLKADRYHPKKKNRPLAAGLVSPQSAKLLAAVLLPASFIWGYGFGANFLLIIFCYFVLQLFYNYRLKEIVILDVFCISAGYFLRVIAGAVIIKARISHWLIICSILLSMFLALAKRRHELMFMGQLEAGNHRKILGDYNLRFLDQMIGMTTAGLLLSYMLYSVSSETIEKFKTDHLIYTFPFVLYGIFRYLYLIHKKNSGSEPEMTLVTDLPSLFNLLLWAFFCIMIIYGVL